jgi:FkbM family methyltransferase
MLSKWIYYLQSIPTLLAGVRSWGGVLDLLAHPAPGRPVAVRLRDGSRFNIRSLMDLWVLKETCLDRDYERGLPPPGEDWAIMDIGAGLGDFAICMAWRHPRRIIAAFEPFDESYRLLEENVRLNSLANVKAFPFAVGARSGSMLLQTATGVAVKHSTASAKASDSASALRVEGITLEDAFRKAGLSQCDLLKVDCEGGEYEIFLNAPDETLARIRRISMEYHDGCTPHSHAELADFFRQHGFSVALRANPVHPQIGFLTAIHHAA